MTRLTRTAAIGWFLSGGLVAAQVPAQPAPAAVPADAATVFVTVSRIGPRIIPSSAVAPLALPPQGNKYTLTRFDFDLRDGGEGREVLEASTNLPLSLALLVDASASVGRLEWAVKLMDNLAHGLGPDDRISVTRFAEESVSTPFTQDAATFEEAGRDLKKTISRRAGPSPIWDVVNTAITSLEKEPGRPAIILLSDGRVTGNLTRFDFVLQHALASGVTFHGIIEGMPAFTGFYPRSPSLPEPWRNPRRLAQATGGQLLHEPVSAGDLEDTIVNFIRELRGGYRLRFKPYQSDGKPHPLSIRVRTPGFLVRAPESYTPPR